MNGHLFGQIDLASAQGVDLLDHGADRPLKGGDDPIDENQQQAAGQQEQQQQGVHGTPNHLVNAGVGLPVRLLQVQGVLLGQSLGSSQVDGEALDVGSGCTAVVQRRVHLIEILLKPL